MGHIKLKEGLTGIQQVSPTIIQHPTKPKVYDRATTMLVRCFLLKGITFGEAGLLMVFWWCLALLLLQSTDTAKVDVSTYNTRRYVRYASDICIPGVPDFPNLKNKIKSDTRRGQRRYVGGHGRSPDPNKTLTPLLCRPFLLLAGQPPSPPGVAHTAASHAAGQNCAAVGRNRDSLAWIRPSPSPTVGKSKVPASACSILSRLYMLLACRCRCVLACLADALLARLARE
jgi:hypothetical protein